VVTSLVNPPALHPLPSPTLQLATSFVTGDSGSQACLYAVLLNVRDDSGTAGDRTRVVATGSTAKIEALGCWLSQYDATKNNKDASRRRGRGPSAGREGLLALGSVGRHRTLSLARPPEQ
jgi:hypothetical protein